MANKTYTRVSEVKKLCIWGNHADTMYPDIRYCTAGGKPVLDLVDDDWHKNEFIPRVQRRVYEIFKLKGTFSQASAGNAAISHMRDWMMGSDEWQSVGLVSDGSKYNLPKDVVFSVPVTTTPGKMKIVEGLDMDNEFTQKMIKKTSDDLIKERSIIEPFL